MDLFTVFTALTLVVAGVFLCRDYARFLRGSYTIPAKVSSIQQVFIPSISDLPQRFDNRFVQNGFYPVIEYKAKGGPVSFTAIDVQASGRFHVGDEVKLRIRKTRRRENRVCKMAMTLLFMTALLSIILISDAALSGFSLPVERVFFASVVLAVCFASLVAYVRDCDELRVQELKSTQGGRAQLYLFEPTAFTKWKTVFKDPIQLYKIRSKQLVGATCMCMAMLMLAAGI